MKLIAHRGLWNKKSEQNKYISIQQAFNDNHYEGVEFDIRVTNDNKYIINHDAILNNKIISKSSSKSLKKYNIETLANILKIETNKIFLLEIKDRNINVNKLNDYLNKYHKNLYVMSFHNNVIDSLLKLKHNYKLGILNYILNSDKTYKYDFICLLDSLTTSNMIKKYKSNNIEVFIYGKLSNKFNHGNTVYYIVDPYII